jgi:hypothetical protein
MKFLIILILNFYCVLGKLSSQSIEVYSGLLFSHSNKIGNSIIGEDDFSHSDFPITFTLNLDLKRHNYYPYISFTKYKGKTLALLNSEFILDSYGNSIEAIGYNGVNVYKVDCGMKVPLLNYKNFIALEGLIAIGFQKSIKNGFDFYEIDINGKDYFAVNPIMANAYSNFQIVPSIGFHSKININKSFYFNLIANGSYGFKKIQEIYFEYSFKGSESQRTIIESSGSGIYFGIGLGYKFKA